MVVFSFLWFLYPWIVFFNKFFFPFNLYSIPALQRPIGLLSLLNGESAFPEATDMSFFKIMKHHLNSHSCFKEDTAGAFGVLHCAGEVSFEFWVTCKKLKFWNLMFEENLRMGNTTSHGERILYIPLIIFFFIFNTKILHSAKKLFEES